MVNIIDPALTYEQERGKPMPSENHGFIEIALGNEFSKHREFRVGAELSLEFGLTPEPTPDVVVYPRKPLDLLNDRVRVPDPPLLIVEIESPSQTTQQMIDRARLYLENGVKSVWIVSPPHHSVTILTAEGKEERHSSGVVTDPAIGVSADLDAVFS